MFQVFFDVLSVFFMFWVFFCLVKLAGLLMFITKTLVDRVVLLSAA